MLTDYEKYSDAQLLQCYQKGNEVAGNILFQRYRVSLHKFFERRIGRNREDVEDLAQETSLEALKSLKKGQSLTSFRAWLYKIATRVLARWIDEKQKQGVQVTLDAVPADESEQMDLTELLPAPVLFQPEHGVIDNEFGDIRLRFERTLRPKELAVFQLRQNSDMTFEEIGRELRIKPGTAKVRYHRAVAAFKAWLKKHYPDIYYSLSDCWPQVRNQCVQRQQNLLLTLPWWSAVRNWATLNRADVLKDRSGGSRAGIACSSNSPAVVKTYSGLLTAI